MKNHILEKIFFIFLNFSFTPIGIWIYCKLFAFFSLKIIIYLHHVNPLMDFNSNRDLNLFLSIIFIILIYLLVKCISFLILYKDKKQFPYIHIFFDKFRIDRKFMWKILGIVLLSDLIISYSIWKFDTSYDYMEITMSIPFTLILNYLIFMLFFHPVKKDKIAEDGSIIQGKIANIITNIFIILNVVLIAITEFFLLLFLIF